VHATAVTVDPTFVEVQPEPEDNPDAKLPPADDNRPSSGEEDNLDAKLPPANENRPSSGEEDNPDAELH